MFVCLTQLVSGEGSDLNASQDFTLTELFFVCVKYTFIYEEVKILTTVRVLFFCSFSFNYIVLF